MSYSFLYAKKSIRKKSVRTNRFRSPKKRRQRSKTSLTTLVRTVTTGGDSDSEFSDDGRQDTLGAVIKENVLATFGQFNFIGSFQDFFMSKLQEASSSFLELRDLFQQNPVELIARAGYYSSSVIIGTVHNGIIFDFGFYGAGSVVQGFKHVRPNLRVTAVPEFLHDALDKALSKSGLSSVIKLSPFKVFLVRVVQLAMHTARQDFSLMQSYSELMLLFYKLTQTKGFTTFQDVWSNVPPVFKVLMDTVQFGRKSLHEYVKHAWQDFEELKTLPVTIQSVENTSVKNFAQLKKMMHALALQTVIAIDRARENEKIAVPLVLPFQDEEQAEGNNEYESADEPYEDEV